MRISGVESSASERGQAHLPDLETASEPLNVLLDCLSIVLLKAIPFNRWEQAQSTRGREGGLAPAHLSLATIRASFDQLRINPIRMYSTALSLTTDAKH